MEKVINRLRQLFFNVCSHAHLPTLKRLNFKDHTTSNLVNVKSVVFNE